MSQSSFQTLQEKLLAALKRFKELCTKDYSLHDLKNLAAKAKGLQKKLSQMSVAGDASGGLLKSKQRWDVNHILGSLKTFVVRQSYLFLVLLVLAMAILLHRFVLASYETQIQSQLAMRPAQWSQLQSLVKLSKASPTSPLAMASTVTPLDEMELQKVRSILTARGLKPAVLRLTTDNPPRLEIQVSDAMFSLVLDVLDELRSTWRLYPTQMNVVSAAGPGVVNVSATFLQFSAQPGVGARQ
jgi:type II secretory pathway component PulM